MIRHTFALSLISCLAVAACGDSDQTATQETDTGSDATDTSGDGSIETDGSSAPDADATGEDTRPDIEQDVQGDTDADSPDVADVVPDDVAADALDSDGAGDAGDGDTTETDGSADADVDAGPTVVAGSATLAGFGVSGVTITASSTTTTVELTETTSPEDGSYSIALPAGEWTLTATLADHEFTTAEPLVVGDRDGEIDQDFRLRTTTVAFDPDGYAASSPLEPAALPVLNGALQYRTITADGGGVWLRVNTDETGPLAIFTTNLGLTTDSRIQVFDAVAYLDDDVRVDLAEEFGDGREDDDSSYESTLLLPYVDSGVTDYLVFVGNYDDPCGYGTFFLGAASGDAITDADEDGSIAALDCEPSDGAVYPGAEEPLDSTVDLNCDGIVGAELADAPAKTNLTRAMALPLEPSPVDAIEYIVNAGRIADRDIYTFDTDSTYWFSLDLPDRKYVLIETVVVAGTCNIETRWFEDDNDFQNFNYRLNGPFLNFLDRNVVLNGEFRLGTPDEDETLQPCAVQFVLLALGFDNDDDARPSNGYGGDRDLDDTDEDIESCNIENER